MPVYFNRREIIFLKIADIMETGMEVDAVDVIRKEDIFTVDDIYALADWERAELIDGKIYYMASPNTKHQVLVMDLSYQIKDYIKQNNGECQVIPAPFAVFLDDSHINYVEPDISVICDMDKLTDKGCQGAPDWIIEIVSPSSRDMDYFTKLFKYQTAGVREYWIVDPMKEQVMVYQFEMEMMEQYTFGEEIPAGIYEGFFIKAE